MRPNHATMVVNVSILRILLGTCANATETSLEKTVLLLNCKVRTHMYIHVCMLCVLMLCVYTYYQNGIHCTYYIVHMYIQHHHTKHIHSLSSVIVFVAVCIEEYIIAYTLFSSSLQLTTQR